MSSVEEVVRACGCWAMAGAVVAPAIPGCKTPMTHLPGNQWRGIADGRCEPPPLEWTVEKLRSGEADGIGIFCGSVSGGLEMAETDTADPRYLEAVAATAQARGLGDLWHRLVTGCVEVTPSGGRHHFMFIDGGPCRCNRKLSFPAPTGNPETDNKATGETRGQGGWVVVAPSFGRTHATGRPYQFIAGSPATIPTFTPEQRDALYGCFIAQCQRPPAPPKPAAAYRQCEGQRIGDRFTRGTTWQQVLGPHGWASVGEVTNREGQVVTEWSRPGREGQRSAVTGGHRDVLVTFSTATAFTEYGELPGVPGTGYRGYERFAAYVVLRHSGNYKAATAYLHECRQAGLTWPQIAEGRRPVRPRQKRTSPGTAARVFASVSSTKESENATDQKSCR